MTNDKQAFINAINANPFDMAIVLVFCDWLEEHADDTIEGQQNKVMASVYRKSVAPGHHSYYPEMGEVRPFGHIKAQLSHTGKHWFLRTPLKLSGRGVTHLGVIQESEVVESAKYLVGANQYKVTDSAFLKLCDQYAVYSESLL